MTTLHDYFDLCTQMPYLPRYGLPLPFVLLAVLTRLPGLQSYATLWKDVKSGVWWVDIIYVQYTLQVLAEMQKNVLGEHVSPKKSSEYMLSPHIKILLWLVK